MLQTAPPFTKENASEMRWRGYVGQLAKANARIAQLEKQLEAALTPAIEDDQRRRTETAWQIDQIDRLTRKHPNDLALLIKSANAKKMLWELLYPKPGSLRPKQSRAESRAPIQPIAPASPAPIVPPQAPETTDKPQPVVPLNPAESHNSQ